jgi:glycosyltransferase involved in cell wall biosynthesis
MIEVAIVTTAHWSGDPRLGRHVRYLKQAGHRARLISFAGTPRLMAMWKALRAIATSSSTHVLLPDPDLFLLGSLTARITGKRPVIDIHEDYPKAAMARPWVPDWARTLVKIVASFAVSAGRAASWRVLVAAPELARSGDRVALNIPDPSSLPMAAHDGSNRIVYVGDVTEARGAVTMVETLAELDESFRLSLIGRAGVETRGAISSMADRLGVADRIEFTGQLEHDKAWSAARAALAGLNLLQPVPAYREAVATKLWEYMAVGLPPVVSDLPGQRRLVEDLDPRLVVRSPTEAAAVLRELSRDPERRAALAVEARRIAEQAWEESRPDLVVQQVFTS